MGLYYNVIDPSIFITTIVLCIATMIMTYQTHEVDKNRGIIYTLMGLIIFYSLMFLLFNFRFIYNKQNKKRKQDAYAKSYDALYDFGTRHRNIEFSFGMIVLAFLGFMAALTMISFGVYLFMLSSRNHSDDDENLEPIPTNIQTMIFITGLMCILCGMIAMARMPLQYLFLAMGLRSVLVLLFNNEIY